MNFNKYIIKENIPQFQKFMIDYKSEKRQDLMDDVPSYESLTLSKSGRRRSILSSSIKWNKVKGVESYGVTGMYLAPANHIDGLNSCKNSGLCKKGCIAYTGHLGMFHANTIRLRTLALFHYTERYLLDMLRDLYIQAFKASIDNKELYCRLNGTSDLPFYKVLNMDLIVKDFNGLAGFYDYTKFPHVKNPWANYHLTFSYSEKSTSIGSYISMMNNFDRVAIVVTEEDKNILLDLYSHYDQPCIDGDLHDIRPLDKGRFVLLQAKNVTAAGKSLDTEFVQSFDHVVDLVALSMDKGVTV